MQKNFLFLFVLFTMTIKSQITITSAQMPVSGDTIRYSNARLSSVGDYTTTGTNYNWHFDTLKPTSQDLRNFYPALSTPYFIFFFPPKYGEKTQDTVINVNIPTVGPITITDVYSFYRKTSSLFASEGLGIKINGIPVPNTYSNEDEIYQFPLNYGNRDSSNFVFSTPSTTLIPFVYTKQGHRITEVDGWGTVTTPYGSEPCLRVITTQYSKDTISATIAGFPFKLGFPNYQRSYQWLTLGERTPFFEVSGILNGSTFNETQARYRDVITNFVGLKEQNEELKVLSFPNPASQQLTIMVPKSRQSVRAELVDMQGKIVLIQELKNNSEALNQHLLDISSASKGLYILNLSNLEGKQTIKISIQ